MKTSVIYIRTDPKDKALIQADARKERRSMSSFLLWCWEMYHQPALETDIKFTSEPAKK